VAEKKLFVRDATGLVRELSGSDIFVWTITNVPLLLGFVAMLFWVTSSGLLNVDYVATILMWMAGAGAIVVMYWAMAGAMPRAGGDYAWGSRALHPAVGFVMSWSFVWVEIFAEATGIYMGISFLSSGLSIAAKMSSDVGLQAFADAVSTPTATIAIGVVIMIFAAVASCLGKRFLKGVIYFIFFTGVIILLTSFGLLISASRDAYITSFNGISGLSYDQVLAQAKFAGYMPIATLAASVSAVPYAVGSLGPHYGLAYMAGDVKRPRRSVLYGMIGAWAISSIVWLLLFVMTDSTIGMRFIESLSFLFTNKPDVYAQTGIATPTANLLLSVITRNPLIVELLAFGLFVTNFGWMIVIFPVNARIILAWSFDRVIPEKFSHVSDRFATPIYGILFTAVASIALFALTYVYPYAFYFNMTLLSCVQLCLACLTAIVLPYRRKDVFDNSPLKAKIGGIPVLSLLGVFGLILYVFVAYSALTNPALGPISATALGETGGAIIAGLVVFYVARAFRKRQGMDFDATFREIPPE
jgi:APA family basic amino acid/polyamine antiporter